MDGIIDTLANNPLLLLFVVAAIGYPIGRIHVRGASLGVAAVLFVGLAIGAIDPRLKLPEFVYSLGLILFVYTVGLSSGPGFLASLRGRGLRNNLFVLVMVALAAGLVAIAHYALSIPAPQAAGLYTGTLTNTPALAGVIEHLKLEGLPDSVLSEPVVGYSLAYPVSVLGMILAILIAQRVWKVNYASEGRERGQDSFGAVPLPLQSRTILIDGRHHDCASVRDLMAEHKWNVVFGRVRHEGKLSIVTEGTQLCTGDLVTVVGAAGELERVTADLGERNADLLDFDRSQLDYRRIFVSNPKVAGHRLRDLDLPQHYGAVVTRVRRGDIELLPHGDTVLELGDRVRVLTSRESMGAVATFFGDSYKAVSEIDILSFSLGLMAGLLLGMVPIPFFGGITLTLGIAGGPLIVALLLGALERTGPIVWSLPYSANLMLRQVGLVLFLAGVGTRSGYDFFQTLAGGDGTMLLVAAVVVVAVTALITLWVGYKLMKIPMGVLSGVLSAVQTQPATLAFALEQSGDERPNLGYAAVYPVSLIGKIIIAQLLLVWLR